jgi:hypothetical protein
MDESFFMDIIILKNEAGGVAIVDGNTSPEDLAYFDKAGYKEETGKPAKKPAEMGKSKGKAAAK